MEVRDRVRQPRHGLPQRGLGDLHVPARVGDGDRAGAQPGVPQGVEGVRVRGALGHHPVPGPAQQAHDQRERLLRTGRDQDLLGAGRQPPPGEPLGDGTAQVGQPEGVVAGAPGEARQPGRGPGEGLGEGVLRGAQGGDGQVDPGIAVGDVAAGADQQVRADRPVALGEFGPGTGSAPAADVAALAQQVVGPGDGGAAGAERLGELALGGQPYVQGDPAVQDQGPHGVGEGPVAGAGQHFGGQQGRELAAADGSVRRLDDSPVCHANLP